MVKKRNFVIVLLGIVFVMLFIPMICTSAEQPSEKGVASVNGSIISTVEFDKEIELFLKNFEMQGKQPTELEIQEIKNEVLNRLIEIELLYQESQKKGFNVDDKEIEDQIDKFRNQFESEEMLQNALGYMGLTLDDLRVKIKRGIGIKRYIDKEFDSKVNVTDDEVRVYYDTNKNLFTQPEMVKASHILVKVDEGADKEQKAKANKKIKEIQQKLQKGETFESLATEHSDCPSGKNGGDLGYFPRGRMVKPFEDTAFSTKPGEVSDIVETDFGYHIIKVTDKKPETTIAYDDAKDRIRYTLKKQKTNEEVARYIPKLKEKAKIEIFMKDGGN